MNNWKFLALLGAILIVAGAAGTAFYMQGSEPAQALDFSASAPAPFVADVPEAQRVHEGEREAIPMDFDGPVPMTVYAAPTCGCCGLWAEQMKEFGFEIEEIHRSDMGEVKRALGVAPQLSSCHTAVVNDYVIEGHVPGEDLRRFLAEAPPVRGLTVPGMPLGSPGMEMPSGEVDRYQVLTFTADGRVEVFAEHGPVPPREG
jgi:hypothetical protein